MRDIENEGWHLYPNWYYQFPFLLFPIMCIIIGYWIFNNADNDETHYLIQIISILAIIMIIIIIWSSVFESRVLRKVFSIPRLVNDLWDTSYQILIASLDEVLTGAEKVSPRWFDSAYAKSYSPEVDTPFRYRISGEMDVWIAFRLLFSQESFEVYVSKKGIHLLKQIDVAVEAGCSKMGPTSM